MSLAPLWAAKPITIVHALVAVVALAGGLGALVLKKGSPAHIVAGRVFVAAMLAAAITSFGISGVWRGSYSPIHLLSILTIATVPLAIRAARRGEMRRHARVMMLNFMGLLIAGAFAVASPGRVLHDVFAMARDHMVVAGDAP